MTIFPSIGPVALICLWMVGKGMSACPPVLKFTNQSPAAHPGNIPLEKLVKTPNQSIFGEVGS